MLVSRFRTPEPAGGSDGRADLKGVGRMSRTLTMLPFGLTLALLAGCQAAPARAPASDATSQLARGEGVSYA